MKITLDIDVKHFDTNILEMYIVNSIEQMPNCKVVSKEVERTQDELVLIAYRYPELVEVIKDEN